MPEGAGTTARVEKWRVNMRVFVRTPQGRLSYNPMHLGFWPTAAEAKSVAEHIDARHLAWHATTAGPNEKAAGFVEIVISPGTWHRGELIFEDDLVVRREEYVPPRARHTAHPATKVLRKLLAELDGPMRDRCTPAAQALIGAVMAAMQREALAEAEMP
jgi:hypothetical protein